MNNKYILFSLALASGFSASMADSFNVFMKDGRVVEYSTDIVDSVVFVKDGESIGPVIPNIPSDTTAVVPSESTTPGVVATQGDIKILTSGGWLETCFATWSAYSGASKYKVSVKKSSENNYVDVDDFVEQIPYLETQNYIKKVYRTYWNYLRIYEGIKF